MRKPTTLLAVLPILLLLAAPAANADHRTSKHAKKKLLRLADEVADGTRLVHRAVAGRHGRHTYWGPGRDQGFYGPRDRYTLTVLANLELHAHAFERALQRHPIAYTHREFEALARTFDQAADALYRVRVSPTVERDFECLAEYMYALTRTYEDYAYRRRARYRGDYHGRDGRYDRRVEVYGPRWNVTWRQDGWLGYDRDWDSDSDSDSDSY